jgi:hypothetical protein
MNDFLDNHRMFYLFCKVSKIVYSIDLINLKNESTHIVIIINRKTFFNCLEKILKKNTYKFRWDFIKLNIIRR